MRSVRDIVNKLPDTRKGLESYVLEYSPEIKSAVEENPRYRELFNETIDTTFDKYSKHLGGLTSKLAGAGHAVGYTADAWLATGDIIGSLGGNFIDLLAQIPEKSYSLVYAFETGNYLDSLQNVFEGIVSYLPGFTLADQGLNRIIQKRMVKEVTHKMHKELGIKETSWLNNIYKRNKDNYSDVKLREENVVSPRESKRQEKDSKGLVA